MSDTHHQKPLPDQLNDFIKNYVWDTIPKSELNTGLAVEIFTKGQWSAPLYGIHDPELENIVGNGIATLTDRYLRLHFLDICWQPTTEEYQRIADAIETEDEDALYLYDVCPERCGRKLCYLPSQFHVVHIPRQDITKVKVETRDMTERLNSGLDHYHNFTVKNYRVLTVYTWKADCTWTAIQEICSVYSGIEDMYEMMNPT